MTDLDVAPATDPDVRAARPGRRRARRPSCRSSSRRSTRRSRSPTSSTGATRASKAAGIRGEILIVDSSDDDTAELALAGGARVLKTPAPRPRPGLHRRPPLHPRAVRPDGRRRLHLRLPRARRVRRAVPRGLRVRHGLALEGLDREGRHAGPAPVLRHALHDVDPQPASTARSSPTSTAACGASPATRSSAWTSARSRGSTPPRWCSSRCTWTCARPRCRSRFLKDREGRLSHHKRSGWFSPFSAAWINLRAMFVYGADFFLSSPGSCCSRSGCC